MTASPLANYQPTNVPDFVGNPLIEALPVFSSQAEVYELLRQKGPSNIDLKNLSLTDRYDLINLARRFFKPYSQVMLLYQAISSMIRVGYANRNPFENGNGYWPGVQEKADGHSSTEINHRFFATPQGPFKSLGQTIIGLGGTGKTYAIESILHQVYRPQVIIHQNYHGRPFPFIQIVWIKVNCPVGGTVKGVCASILLEIDFILGTTYYEDYKGNKTTLMNAVAIVCRNHGVGLIVVDEIQNLVAARGQDRDEILDFYTALENVKGTPIIKIGTPKTKELFTKLHTARRAVGPVPPYWSPMNEDDEWQSFSKKLWALQYTDQFCPWSEELSHLLYEVSQGILDFAVKAFLFAQIRAIHNGLPTITPKLIESVVHDHFKAAQKILDTLRNKEYEKLEEFDDVVIDFDEHYQQFLKERKSRSLKNLSQGQLEVVAVPENTTVERADQANELKASVKLKNMDKKTKAPKKQQSVKVSVSELNPDDLRFITAESAGNATATYEALKAAGRIKNADEFTNLSI